MGFQLYPAQWCKAPSDRLGQIRRRTIFLPFKRIVEDRTQFRLHRVTVTRRAHSQALLHSRVNVPDGQRRHASIVVIHRVESNA